MPFYYFKIKRKSPYNKWGLYLIAEQNIPMNFSPFLLNMKYSTFFLICGMLIFSTPSYKGLILAFSFALVMKALRFSEIKKINKHTIRRIYLIKNRKNEVAVELFNSRQLLMMKLNYISITHEQIFDQVDNINHNMPLFYLKKIFFIPTNISVYDRQAFDAVLNGIVPYFEDVEGLNGKKYKYQKLETNDYLSYKF